MRRFARPGRPSSTSNHVERGTQLSNFGSAGQGVVVAGVAGSHQPPSEAVLAARGSSLERSLRCTNSAGSWKCLAWMEPDAWLKMAPRLLVSGSRGSTRRTSSCPSCRQARIFRSCTPASANGCLSMALIGNFLGHSDHCISISRRLVSQSAYPVIAQWRWARLVISLAQLPLPSSTGGYRHRPARGAYGAGAGRRSPASAPNHHKGEVKMASFETIFRIPSSHVLKAKFHSYGAGVPESEGTHRDRQRKL
jgi:hypothetical protein